MRWLGGRPLRWSTALLALAGSSFIVVGRATEASASTTDTLLAGQQLVAHTTRQQLRAAGYEYQLNVEPDSLDLDQWAPLSGPNGFDSTGTGVWFRDDPTGLYQSNTDHSVLRMQTDGNLVLSTSSHHVLWSSHTAGTGSQNRLVLQSHGNLVIYTSANHVVWSSGTTAVLLPAGRTLPSGAHMSFRWGDQMGWPATRLVMQTSGDLEYICGSHVQWRTHTYVHGSYAYMQKNGNFVIYSPAGKPLWSSRTWTGGPYSWFNGQSMTIANMTKRLWSANIPYNAPC